MLTKIIFYAYTQCIFQAVVKYSIHHKEKSKEWKEDINRIDNWMYDEASDTWCCPGGKILRFRYESKQCTESGYEINSRHYRSENCRSCSLKSRCTKAQGNREIRMSLKYLRQKEQARQLLQSKEGYRLKVQRMIEPKSVFGQMKNNRKFRLFLLRGLSSIC